MSQSDHFIDEVTEELRRDQLYGRLKRWAPIIAGVIVAFLAVMSYQKYNASQTAKAAAVFGDGLRDALVNAEEASTDLDVSSVAATSPAQKAMIEVLQNMPVAQNVSSAALRDLFAFQQALALEVSDQRRAGLTAIYQKAGVFSHLAQEQLIHMDITEKRFEAALASISELENAAGVSNDLLYRISQTKAGLESGIFQ